MSFSQLALVVHWCLRGFVLNTSKGGIGMRMFIAGLIVTVLLLATYFVRHMERIW